MGCVDTSDEESYYIALSDGGAAAEYFDEESGCYVFEAGNVDWQVFRFGLYAPDGTLQEELTVEKGMISSDDLAKTENGGIFRITVHYQGLELVIPLKLLTPAVPVYYSVTYHAGAGATFPDADPAEIVSGDDGPEWTITYKDGKIDTTPVAEKPGYSFKGWRTENGATAASGITIDSDRHYYAAWTDDIAYNVNVYRYNDGEFVTLLDAYSGKAERNTQFVLPTPEPSEKYAFGDYTIIVDGEEEISVTEPGASITVTADTEIRINYVTNTFTVRFIVNADDAKVGTQTHPWSLEGATVNMNFSDQPIPIQYVENVVSYGGNSIDGYCLIMELKYGEPLGTDSDYVPPVPNVYGATGTWRGTNGLNAVFGPVTSELNYVAGYTLISYSAAFLMPPAGYLTPSEVDEAGVEFETVKGSNGSDLVFGNLHYGETVLESSKSFPGVPVREGYIGEWVFRTQGNDWSPVYDSDGNLADELSYIEKNHVIAASYKPADYTVTLHDVKGEIIYSGSYAYSTEFVIPGDIAAQIEETYPSDLYIIQWRNGRANGNVVALPLKVSGNINLYISLSRQPYTVEFRGRGNVSFDPVIKVVTPNLNGTAEVELPEISIPGYVVIGWSYNDFSGETIIDYVSGQSYPQGTKVRYENSIYIADSDADGNQVPGVATSIWRNIDENYRKTIEQSSGQISVTSSHVYSQNKVNDTAFYVITEQIYYTVKIGEATFASPGADPHVEDSGKTISVRYNETILTEGQTGADAELLTNPEPPVYSEVGSTGNFVFDGWYLDREYTVPVDIYEYVLTEKTVQPDGTVFLYPRWTDTNLGTRGLVFEQIAGTSDYAVVGFDRSGYEEFSTIILYIPDYYNGGRVTEIRSGAFSDVSKILTFKELHIEANLETIEDNALSGLIGLSLIAVGSSDNFKYENGLLTDKYETVLYYCIATVGEVVVPDTVTRISGGAFAGNLYVQRVVFGADSVLTEIGDSAFFGAMNLSEIALPASLATIGENAFKGCLSLNSVSVNAGSALKEVRGGAFDDCLNALGAPDKNGFITLGGVLIKYTGGNTEVTLPDSVTAIAAGAFESDSGAALRRLTVTADSSLGYIADGAFDGAISLTRVYMLLSSVPVAAAGAFDGVPVDSTLWVNALMWESFDKDKVYASAFGGGIKVYG